MPGTITITAGRQRQGDEKDFTGPDGTYQVTLAAVSDEITEPSTIVDPRKPNKNTWTYRDWTLAIDGGEFDGQVLDVRASAESSGPKSKQYGMVAAFVGRTPPVGTQIDIQKHLVGRQALAYIVTSDSGFPKVESVMALPGGGKTNGTPAATPAPEPVPAAAPVATGDDLPF